MSKFEEKIKDLTNSDQSTISSKRSWNRVDAAFQVKIAKIKAELVEAKLNFEETKTKLELAKINNGKPVSNGEFYIMELIRIKNDLIDLENKITELDSTLTFLGETRDELI